MLANTISVPVIIDSIKRSGPALCRCVYFSVECDEPAPGWELRFGAESVPMLIFGISGVIHAPLMGERFETYRDFVELFDLIEERDQLFVDTQDVWMPNYLFANGWNEVFERQSLFRIAPELFNLGRNHRMGRMENNDLIRLCEAYAGTVEYSPVETIAFGEWIASIIEQTRALKEPETRLPRRGVAPDGGPR